MDKFNLVVSTPEGDAFNGEAVFLSVRGAAGDLAVMAKHAPLVTTVKKGKSKIIVESGNEIVAVSGGGLLTVSDEKTIFLTPYFKRENEE